MPMSTSALPSQVEKDINNGPNDMARRYLLAIAKGELYSTIAEAVGDFV